MKILHSIHSVNPTHGGPIEVVKQLAAVHCQLGHAVEVVSVDSPEEAWVKGSPVPVHALGPASSSYGYSSALLPWLRERHQSYDAVIVHGLWQFTSLAVRMALNRSETPYVVFPHGMLDPWFKRQYPLKHAKKLLYWHCAERRVLHDAKKVIFTCEEERRLAYESFPRQDHNESVVPLGITGYKGSVTDPASVFLESYPQLRGKRILLFLSRIHEKKGCDLLLRAFAKVIASARSADSSRELHLAIIGPCENPEYLAKLHQLADASDIGPQVTWIGMLTGVLKWGALRAAEALVLPSHQENFGIVVAEALSCGTPVLLSKRVNIWREVIASGAGLAGKDTVDGTFESLRKWLALSPTEQSAMARTARICFEEKFEATAAATRIIELLESSIAPHSPSICCTS